jgi:enoyl-CoA hydratase/carnithine racemase
VTHTRLDREGIVLVITFARGKANALNAELVEELHAAFAQTERDASVRGVVLASDHPKLFSGGFDVDEVFSYDEPTMGRFFGRFLDLFERMRHLPKPLVCAVGGHAYAGAAILALACDRRIFVDGDVGFAINEVNLGVVLPDPTIAVIVETLGLRTARHLLLDGAVFKGQDALRAGIVDEVVPAREVLTRAIGCARLFASKPPLAYAEHKRALLAKGTPRLEGAARELAVASFMTRWVSEESVAARAALVESLSRKS